MYYDLRAMDNHVQLYEPGANSVRAQAAAPADSTYGKAFFHDYGGSGRLTETSTVVVPT